MSHFSVLVVAKDSNELDARLLPYHEYECTGFKQYLEFVPADLDELQKEYEEHGKEYKDLDEFAKEWNGYEKNAEGVYGRLTNPNAKWDWWSIGGRWKGELVTKEKREKVDTALAGEIDWELMRKGEQEFRRTRYKAWHNLPKVEDVGEDAHRRAAFENNFILVSRSEVDDLNNLTEEEYVAKYGTSRAITFALVDETGWHERATMGWFGMTHDDNDNFDKLWWEKVLALPSDQRVYVVDCHI